MESVWNTHCQYCWISGMWVVHHRTDVHVGTISWFELQPHMSGFDSGIPRWSNQTSIHQSGMLPVWNPVPDVVQLLRSFSISVQSVIVDRPSNILHWLWWSVPHWPQWNQHHGLCPMWMHCSCAIHQGTCLAPLAYRTWESSFHHMSCAVVLSLWGK